jgi:hypothetical protein
VNEGVNEGVNFTPRGQISPLGARGEVKNGPQALLSVTVGRIGSQEPILRQRCNKLQRF